MQRSTIEDTKMLKYFFPQILSKSPINNKFRKLHHLRTKNIKRKKLEPNINPKQSIIYNTISMTNEQKTEIMKEQVEKSIKRIRNKYYLPQGASRKYNLNSIKTLKKTEYKSIKLPNLEQQEFILYNTINNIPSCSLEQIHYYG